jgi:flagellar protein FliS
MYSTNGYNIYKTNSVNYTSKDQILLLLIEGAVKFSKDGRQAIIDKDIKKAHDNIVKTQNIFYELIIALDVSKDGKWVKPIVNVYGFIIRRLIDANIRKDSKIMDEVIPLIENVKDIWIQACKIAKK